MLFSQNGVYKVIVVLSCKPLKFFVLHPRGGSAVRRVSSE